MSEEREPEVNESRREGKGKGEGRKKVQEAMDFNFKKRLRFVFEVSDSN
jgi:hypothetical protein